MLRVFGKASNSLISRQLGEIWRLLPNSVKNQYDEEALRLVKIHQAEFPHYKYQPKKKTTPIKVAISLPVSPSLPPLPNTHQYFSQSWGPSNFSLPPMNVLEPLQVPQSFCFTSPTHTVDTGYSTYYQHTYPLMTECGNPEDYFFNGREFSTTHLFTASPTLTTMPYYQPLSPDLEIIDKSKLLQA